jgi:hypothetical protein
MLSSFKKVAYLLFSGFKLIYLKWNLQKMVSDFSDSLCSGSSTLEFVCHVNFTVKRGLATRNAPKN